MRQTPRLLSRFRSALRGHSFPWLRRCAQRLGSPEASASALAAGTTHPPVVPPVPGAKDIMSTLSIERPIHLVRLIRAGLDPIVLHSGLVASATGTASGVGELGAEALLSGGAMSNDDLRALAALRAKLSVNPLLLRRLVGLWNTVILAGCDEIGDGNVHAGIEVTSTLLPMTLQVRAVGVTVFADGLASFSVVIDGVDTPLWLSEQLDLSAVVDARGGD